MSPAPLYARALHIAAFFSVFGGYSWNRDTWIPNLWSTIRTSIIPTYQAVERSHLCCIALFFFFFVTESATSLVSASLKYYLGQYMEIGQYFIV